MDKVFRIGEEVGPDYKCDDCGLHGYRLWRKTHTFLDYQTLRCAVCAEKDQVKQIEAYAHFSGENSTFIGDLVPARPTPEGDTFWGHTSGDVSWWYMLPQYTDQTKEARILFLERNKFLKESEYYIEKWYELYRAQKK